MNTLIAFLVTLGVLIVVHEWGHYRVARACGVKVLRFSIGFGKTVWERRIGDTARFARAAGEDASNTSFVAGMRIWF